MIKSVGEFSIVGFNLFNITTSANFKSTLFMLLLLLSIPSIQKTRQVDLRLQELLGLLESVLIRFTMGLFPVGVESFESLGLLENIF